MGTLMTRNQQIERNKRYLFLSVEGAGITLTLLGSPILGVIAIGAGAYLGWRWFKFRAKNGMRF